MKNLPHQFNDLDKLYNSLEVVRDLIEENTPLTDENFGEQLTREGIYSPRDKSLTIDEYLEAQKDKIASNRGYYTASRDTRRFFQLLGFITVYEDKTAEISPAAKELLNADREEEKQHLWKSAFLNLGLEGTDGEISHPYRVLIKLVNKLPGIETKKLMLALEAENDSDEEFERILALAEKPYDEIVEEIGCSESMAANAAKILPGIAEQLGDIERLKFQAYPVSNVIVTEDDITSEEHSELAKERSRSNYRAVDSSEIATDPNLNDFKSVNIDLADAINIRQKRLTEHQDIVRLLGKLNEENDLDLFEGKFDCLGTKNDEALLYEVKTILDNSSDQEKQTVKGVGQIKFYKYSIVNKEMGYSDIQEFIVFSQKPTEEIQNFCLNENISVIWKVAGDDFLCISEEGGEEKKFDPSEFLSSD